MVLLGIVENIGMEDGEGWEIGTRLNGNETRNFVEKGYQLHLTFNVPCKRVLCMCFDITVAVRRAT